MTPDQLTACFVNAGFDTPEKVAELLNVAAKHIQVSQLKLALQKVEVERGDAMVPFNTQRNVILSQIQALESQLTPALTQ